MQHVFNQYSTTNLCSFKANLVNIVSSELAWSCNRAGIVSHVPGVPPPQSSITTTLYGFTSLGGSPKLPSPLSPLNFPQQPSRKEDSAKLSYSSQVGLVPWEQGPKAFVPVCASDPSPGLTICRGCMVGEGEDTGE